jgi:hypothetical protein
MEVGDALLGHCGRLPIFVHFLGFASSPLLDPP